MRLLMLPRYGSLGASSRIRMHQYAPELRKAGIDVRVSPLFGDAYVQAIYAGRHAWGDIWRGYKRRIKTQISPVECDAVWIEKELLPWFPALFEQARGRAATVVDYDDAVFHRYDLHPSRVVRLLLGGKIDAVMNHADLITAGNGYLEQRAKDAGCHSVERLPTVVDLSRYGARTHSRNNGVVVIGWIGSPVTAGYLRIVAPALQRISTKYAIRCIAVGARPDQVEGTPFEAVAWSEAGEVDQLMAFDIGVMPLLDEPWERGKCGYKLVQYMACGLPVIASPVGVNSEIVTPGLNGEWATGTEEWVNALSRLIEDAGLRARQGMQGRMRVADRYSLQAQVPRLLAMFQDVVHRARKH